MREARYEFYVDLGSGVLLKLASVVGNEELSLEVSSIAWDSDNIVYVNFRGVCQIDSLVLIELVGDLSKVDDVF